MGIELETVTRMFNRTEYLKLANRGYIPSYYIHSQLITAAVQVASRRLTYLGQRDLQGPRRSLKLS